MFCCACDGPRDEHQSAPTMTPLSEEFMQPPEFMISSEGPLEMDLRKDQSPSPAPVRGLRAAGGGYQVAGCGKLNRARFRLYRSQILQVNMRLKTEFKTSTELSSNIFAFLKLH